MIIKDLLKRHWQHLCPTKHAMQHRNLRGARTIKLTKTGKFQCNQQIAIGLPILSIRLAEAELLSQGTQNFMSLFYYCFETHSIVSVQNLDYFYFSLWLVSLPLNDFFFLGKHAKPLLKIKHISCLFFEFGSPSNLVRKV